MAIAKLKTKFSTGAWLPDIKTFFSKTNEIVDNLNSLVISSTPTYKVYRALLTQAGTTAPTSVILENTLGFVPTLAYGSVGEYTISGTFTTNKTIVFIGSAQTTTHMLLAQEYSGTVYISSTTSGGVRGNGNMAGTSIEIIVYN